MLDRIIGLFWLVDEINPTRLRPRMFLIDATWQDSTARRELQLNVGRFLTPASRRQNARLVSQRDHQRICTNPTNHSVISLFVKTVTIDAVVNAVIRLIRLDQLEVAVVPQSNIS
jgi:hypothetical protein